VLDYFCWDSDREAACRHIFRNHGRCAYYCSLADPVAREDHCAFAQPYAWFDNGSSIRRIHQLKGVDIDNPVGVMTLDHNVFTNQTVFADANSGSVNGNVHAASGNSVANTDARSQIIQANIKLSFTFRADEYFYVALAKHNADLCRVAENDEFAVRYFLFPKKLDLYVFISLQYVFKDFRGSEQLAVFVKQVWQYLFCRELIQRELLNRERVGLCIQHRLDTALGKHGPK